MRVLKLARTPAPCVKAGSTVRETVDVMAEHKSGALVVLRDDVPVGIVSERDVVLRAVRNGMDTATTLVDQIMSEPLVTVTADTATGKAVEVMSANHIRHLGVVDAEGVLVGLLSSRDAFQEHLAFLLDQLLSLESFICADGPGG